MPRGVNAYDEARLQGRLWTPSAMPLEVWFDAADARTLTINNGSVSQWRDKSGNGRHVSQAMTERRPLYLPTGLNGRPALDWGSAANTRGLFVTGMTAYQGDPPRYCGVAAYAGGDPFVQHHGLVTHTFAGAADVLMTNNAGSLWFGALPHHLNGLDAGSSTALPTIRSPFVFCSGAPVNAGRTDIFVGGDRNISVRGWVGQISEIVAHRTLSARPIRQRLEGYLAWKWGLQTRLPAGHPFARRPPLLGD